MKNFFTAEIIALAVSIGMRITAGVCRKSGTVALLRRSQGQAPRAGYGNAVNVWTLEESLWSMRPEHRLSCIP